MLPLFWIFATGWKTLPDSISYPPKVIFDPSAEGYCNLFTTRTRQTPEYIDALTPATIMCDQITRARDMVIARASNYVPRFINSLVISFGSTFAAVVLGTLAAYAFSRKAMSMADDIAVMNQGVIEQLGSPQEIYNHPATLFVASFIGSPAMNLVSFHAGARAGAESLRIGEIDVAVAKFFHDIEERELVLGVRPEHVRLADDAPLRGEVYSTEYLGTTQIVTVRTARSSRASRPARR